MKFTEWNCLCLWDFSKQRRTLSGESIIAIIPSDPVLLDALRLCEIFVMAGMKLSFFSVIYCVNFFIVGNFFVADITIRDKNPNTCTTYTRIWFAAHVMMTLEFYILAQLKGFNHRTENLLINLLYATWQLKDCNLSFLLFPIFSRQRFFVIYAFWWLVRILMSHIIIAS